MDTVRFFQWISSADESARLRADGATVCERSIETHHAHYAILHELTAEQYRAAIQAARAG